MENDLKMDTRKNPENLYAVRMMIVRLSKQGLGPMAIKEQTGVSWGAIRKAIDCTPKEVRPHFVRRRAAARKERRSGLPTNRRSAFGKQSGTSGQSSSRWNLRCGRAKP